MTAINKHGKGEASLSCDTATKPKKVSSFKLKRISKSKVKLRWKKVTCDGYQIYRRTSKGKYKKLRTLSAKKSSYTKARLKVGKKHSYKIRAFVKVSGKKIYGNFSRVGSIKLK